MKSITIDKITDLQWKCFTAEAARLGRTTDQHARQLLFGVTQHLNRMNEIDKNKNRSVISKGTSKDANSKPT